MGLLRALLIFLIALLTACASYDGSAGNFPPQAQLSLNPDGSRLVISWHDGRGGLKARLIALDGAKVESVKNLVLPEKTWTTEFSYDGKNLLITTLQKDAGSTLLKFNLETREQKVIYASHGDLRFPLEIRPDEYAFLESIPGDKRLSQWRRLTNGEISLLDSRHYGLAAPLDITGNAIYVFEPSGMFRVLSGRLPSEVNAIASNAYFSINCSDSAPVFCLRKRLIERGGQYFGVADLVSKDSNCTLNKQWLDSRELRISRNGKSAAFHAALETRDGPRGLYVVDTRDCSMRLISTDRSEK